MLSVFKLNHCCCCVLLLCKKKKKKKGDVICVFASPVRMLSVKVLKREEPNKVQLLLTFMASSHFYYRTHVLINIYRSPSKNISTFSVENGYKLTYYKLFIKENPILFT